MKPEQLQRTLQSIGYKCFIDYFDSFKDEKLSNNELIDILMKQEGYKESGCKTRVSLGKRIFRNNLSKEALNIILSAKKVDPETLAKAQNIFNNESNPSNLNLLWLKFNEYSNKLSAKLGRTNNIVGEYAEYLVHKYFGGELLPISEASADIKGNNGKLYQVKARKLKSEKKQTTQLGIIRSWEFDYLVVVLFHNDGSIFKALEIPQYVAKEYAVANKHQNGWVITTNQAFLNDNRSNNISSQLSSL